MEYSSPVCDIETSQRYRGGPAIAGHSLEYAP